MRCGFMVFVSLCAGVAMPPCGWLDSLRASPWRYRQEDDAPRYSYVIAMARVISPILLTA